MEEYFGLMKPRTKLAELEEVDMMIIMTE